MAATQKAIALARALQDNLNQRAIGVCTTAFDSSGDVYVIVTVGSGNNSVKAMIRFKAQAALGTDSLGNAQKVVTPHIAQVMFDDTTHGTTTTDAKKLAVWGEVLPMGTKCEGYSKNVGAAIMAVADFATATAAGTFESLPWRDIGSV